MRQLGYYFFKYWVSTGLFFYYKRIKIEGLENIPKDKPVLFLSNHQNALMDVLLIATRCSRKPWFLTRADVFKNSLFRPLFRFLQMLPIYRMRDGRGSLSKNKAIFDTCGSLLVSGGALLLFPEANHSLKRQVRPLSKGFTRIIDMALERQNDLDVHLVPIGQNYQCAVRWGDSAAVYYGRPIRVQEFMASKDHKIVLKQEIFNRLTALTSHIADDRDYDGSIEKLKALDTDFTDPEKVNAKLKSLSVLPSDIAQKNNFLQTLGRFLFYMTNLPVVFLWRVLVKPIVPEPEFISTFRFGYAMLAYPIFYMLSFLILKNLYEWKTACLLIVVHAVFNLFSTKVMGVTSSVRRK